MINNLNNFRANLPTTNDVDGGLDRRRFFEFVGTSLAATGLSGRIANAADEAPEEQQPASSDRASSLTQAASCTGGTGIFNVKDFCAVGDGVTDDRPAIQAAIAAAADPTGSGGGIVFFPATIESYLITATVQIPSNVFLQGTGPGSTIRFVNANNPNQPVIQMLGSGNSGVRDIRIVNGNVKAFTLNHGVHMTSHSDGIVERVQIHNCFRSVNVDSSTNIRIVNCDVTDDHSHAASAIHLTGTTRSLVLGCRVQTAGMHGVGLHEGSHYCRVSGCHVDGAAYAAYYVGAKDYAVSTHNVIVGNSASDCQYGVYAENGCDHTVIEGNNFERSGRDGITIAKGDGPAPQYCTVTGNTIRSSGRHAIWLVDAYRCVVSANSIQEAGESGVRIGGGVSNTVSGNQISGANQAAIFIYSQASHTVICGNAIWDNDGTGIYVQASQHCSIVGNTVQKCRAVEVGAITLATWKGSFSSYVTITGNVLVDCPYGIYVLPDTVQVIITGNICYPNNLTPAIFVAGGATVVGYTSPSNPGTNVVSA